jgi:hypothetical protein
MSVILYSVYAILDLALLVWGVFLWRRARCSSTFVIVAVTLGLMYDNATLPIGGVLDEGKLPYGLSVPPLVSAVPNHSPKPTLLSRSLRSTASQKSLVCWTIGVPIGWPDPCGALGRRSRDRAWTCGGSGRAAPVWRVKEGVTAERGIASGGFLVYTDLVRRPRSSSAVLAVLCPGLCNI